MTNLTHNTFCIRLFQFSTCFEQSSAHHQEIQLYQYDIWYMSLYVGDRLVCRFGRSETHGRQNIKYYYTTLIPTIFNVIL